MREGWLDGGSCEPMALAAFHKLTVHAAELNEYRRPAARVVSGDGIGARARGDRPGDHYNAREPWGDILCPYGWKLFHATAGAVYWCRPGKSLSGISASTGFCKGPDGNDLLYVFSTSAAPFEAEASYSKFAAYALLNHRGDYAAAARALMHAGYGVSRRVRVKGVGA